MPDTQRLADLVIEEVSGVDYPANLADGWLVLKNQAGVPAPTTVKGGHVPDIDLDKLDKAVADHITELTAKNAAAEKAAADAATAQEAAIKAAVDEALKKAAEGENEPPKPIDKSKLAPEVRKALEDAEAAQKTAEDAAAAAEVARKAEVEKAEGVEKRLATIEKERRLAGAIAKAATDYPLVGKADELGAQLLDVADTLGEDSAAYKGLTTTLAAANERLKQTGLIKQMGNPGAEASSVEERINKAAADRVAAGTSPTMEQAKMAVFNADPALRREYAEAMNGRG